MEKSELVNRIDRFQRELEELRPITPLKVLRSQFRDFMKSSTNTDKVEASTTLGKGTTTTYTGLVKVRSNYEARISVANAEGKEFFLGLLMDEAEDYDDGIDMDDNLFSLSTNEPAGTKMDETWFTPDGTVNETVAGPTGVFAIEVFRAVLEHRGEAN